ncbi:MAG TPA: hypothetical protein VEL10_06410 [Gaiellaceae bacterium]|nr:hypothetical protein [Gaiellaceae bacterium]
MSSIFNSWKVLGALAVALVVGALTAGAAFAAPGVPGPPAGSPGAAKSGQTAAPDPQAELSKKQEKLIAVAQKLADKGKERGSDFAGVSIDPDTGTVDLFRKDKSKGHGLDSVPAGVKIDVHAAKFSRQEMLDASAQITNDAQLLGEQQHVGIEAVGPSIDGSGVVVTVFSTDAADLDKASKALHGKYGAIVADVHGAATKPSKSDQFFAGFRFNDYAPWYGGDRISTSSLSCTTGFAATYNGLPAMLTASHCGGVGTSFWNGPTSSNGWNFMGNVTYSNSSTDVASIQVSSYSNYINVGSNPQSPTQLLISGWASPVVGQYLCQSGSFTGEVCSLRVVDTGQYVCQSWFLWWCTSWQGPIADVINAFGPSYYSAGHGDSGGPVYLRMGSYGIAEGLVHAVLSPNAAANYPAYGGDTMWCPSPEGWSQRCAAGFSFVHMPGY